MSRFAIPEEVRERADATGDDLIVAFARDQVGPSGFFRVSKAQGYLADWIMAVPARARAFDGIFDLSGDMLGRILGGEIEPDETSAAIFAEVTEGAVAMDDWQRQGRLVAWAPPRGAVAQPICHGRLGEVPPGRLFTAVRDPASAETFVLTGMGLSMRLDRSAGRAMQRALAEALR